MPQTTSTQSPSNVAHSLQHETRRGPDFGPLDEPVAHRSGQSMYWIEGQWAVHSTPPARSQPMLAPSGIPIYHDGQPHPHPHPPTDFQRVVWVHRDSLPTPQQHGLVGNRTPDSLFTYSRLATPLTHTYQRQHPYHTSTSSIRSSKSFTRHIEHGMQLPPIRLGRSVLERHDLPEKHASHAPAASLARERTPAQDSDRHTPAIGGKDGKIQLTTRRHQAHLDSEKKRREAINEGIQAIRRVLPDAGEADSKAVVLEKTLQYIAHLESQLQERREQGNRNRSGHIEQFVCIKVEQE